MDASTEKHPGPALVIAGGDAIDPAVLSDLPSPAWVVAADSGLDRAGALGIRPDLVIGDMDSVDPATLAAVERSSVPVERYPADKDATDLELALERVISRGLAQAIVIGGHGGRLDHLLGNALLFAADRFAAVRIEWRIGTTRILVVRPNHPGRIEGEDGDTVSILSVGGDAVGVTTSGMRWPLGGAPLPTGSTRGISNLLTGREGTVTVDGGVLLVIHERNPSDA